MTEISNDTARVYSNDQKLWTNMTREDAYRLGEENLQLFNFADKNNDKMLDDLEITRYNSPVIVENYEETNNSRIITNGRIDARCIFLDSGLKLSTQIITSTEEEFYAGLKLEEVSKKGSEVFFAMDVDKNGELSAEEMEQVAEIKNKTKEALDAIRKGLEESNNKGVKAIGWTGGAITAAGTGVGFMLEGCASFAVLGGLVGAVAGLGVGLLIGCIVENSGINKTIKKAEETFQNTMGDLMSHPYTKFAAEAFTKAIEEMIANKE